MVHTERNITDSIKKKSRIWSWSDALIPILSLIALILIAIFVLIPMLNNTLFLMQQTESYKKRYEELQEVYTGVYSINTEDLNSNYTNAVTVIPDSMKVGDFAKYINDVAIEDGLELEQIKAEDSRISDFKEIGKLANIRGLRSVEAPLAYVGSYSDIVKFLEDIYVNIPFVISADSVTISIIDKKADLWKVELRIKAYYIDDSTPDKPNLYSKFIPYSRFPTTLIDFRNRAQ